MNPPRPYGFSSTLCRGCGVSRPTSVAPDESLLPARRPSAAGIRVRYWFSFFHFTTRLRLMPHSGVPGGYRSDLNGMAISNVHPSGVRASPRRWPLGSRPSRPRRKARPSRRQRAPPARTRRRHTCREIHKGRERIEPSKFYVKEMKEFTRDELLHFISWYGRHGTIAMCHSEVAHS